MFLDPAFNEYIHLKSFQGDHYTVRKILGLDPTKVHSTNGRMTVPPLFYACRSGHVKVCQVLLQYGADVNFQRQGWTCLHEACARNHLDVVAFLLVHHADPNATQTYSRMTGLMQAARRGFSQMCGLLLHHGADPWQRNADGKTALDLAQDPDTRGLLERAMKHQLLWNLRNSWPASRARPMDPAALVLQQVPHELFLECLAFL